MLYTLRSGSIVKIVNEPPQRIAASTRHERARVIGGSGQTSYPIYSGEYDVVPYAFVDQELLTAGKLMRDNVTVQEIPYLETSNDAGGMTVSIAS